jgi:hypothetical protein
VEKVKSLCAVIENKSRRILITGILRCNIIAIDDCVIEWLDGEDFNLATLAKTIGIDVEHQAKVRITIELAEEPCAICGKITVGDKLCDKCHRVICDECAKKNDSGRHCSTCANT